MKVHISTFVVPPSGGIRESGLQKSRLKSVLQTTLVSIFIAFAGIATADVRLPGMFSDSMVLQRDSKLPVWGWAEPGEEVTVAIAGQKATATADQDGNWRVTLAPLQANSEPQELTITGKNSIVIKDVLVGEVWLCSGQSNMAFGVQNGRDAPAEIAAANFPQIRLYHATRYPSLVPLTEHRGTWAVCSSETVGGWTAVGYFFARELHKELGVPVGLLNASQGSMPIQTFTSLQSLKPIPVAAVRLAEYETLVQECLAQAGVAASTNAAQRDAALRAAINMIDAKLGSCGDQPGSLYNSSIFPLAPYALRGAIWYQGEGDADEPPGYYSRALPALITEWRRIWGRDELPVGVVQLPNFGKRQRDAISDGWPEFRDEQFRGARAVENVGLIVTIDIGEHNNIHPRNKQDVGKRLALWARANVYGAKDLIWSGPVYQSMKIEGDKVRLAFDHVGGGLQFKDGEPRGFAVAGEDKVFYLAKARIDGDSVIVWSDRVKGPVAVRYAWANNPVGNLFNQANLPAMPFRTDDWGVTEVKASDDEKIP